MTENNTPHDNVIITVAAAQNEPAIFSHCVHLKLWHWFHALLKVCSDRDNTIPWHTCIHRSIVLPTLPMLYFWRMGQRVGLFAGGGGGECSPISLVHVHLPYDDPGSAPREGRSGNDDSCCSILQFRRFNFFKVMKSTDLGWKPVISSTNAIARTLKASLTSCLLLNNFTDQYRVEFQHYRGRLPTRMLLNVPPCRNDVSKQSYSHHGFIFNTGTSNLWIIIKLDEPLNGHYNSGSLRFAGREGTMPNQFPLRLNMDRSS